MAAIVENMPELERVIALSRGERLCYDSAQTWVDLFIERARIAPDNTAVVAENGSLSYAELDRLSDRLARTLTDAEGVQPDEFVAVRMGRVKEFFVAVLALHKAGAAYMPIDQEYPTDRVAYMMEDSGARLTLTEQRVAELLHGVGEDGVFASRCRPDSRAYMIYTSGSTGRPKGVVIPHRALTNLVHFIAKRWKLSADSRIALHSNFAFDAAVEDLFPALTVGLISDAAEAISQEPFGGAVEDTAIFACFQDLRYPNPAYYNQSTLLRVQDRASLDALQRASDAILAQHDMLRAVMRDGHLYVRAANETVRVEEYTLEAEETKAVSALCEEIQSHLNLEQALVRLALIHAGKRDLFFLTAHHTIVDGVSWRVWMDDLETAYGQAIRGEDIKLPPKTHTYRDYAEAMKAFRSSYALSLEISYW